MVKKMISACMYLWYAVYYIFAYLLGLFARHFTYYKDLWIITERKTDARDNGLHLFRYITKYHPEVNVAFIITKSSPDYNRVKELGKVIEPYTFRHMLAFACAKVRISTHYMSCAPDTYRFIQLDKFHLVRGKTVMLNHGIIANDMTELHYPAARPDLMACSAIPEYNSIIENYSHPQGVVQRLGLCRYDRLAETYKTKRQILIMPTWRYFLRELDDDEFKNSSYYKNFMSILSDPVLNEKMEQYDYHIVLYLHYELQKYTKLFCRDNSRIEVKELGDADVQDLLMESALLITDYSSVFFDFAYMSKPLAYFQFDEELFFKTQYKRGYFNCHADGFGPVFANADEIIGYICNKIEDGMMQEEEYENRAQRFFGERSADHCEKTYKAISEIL